MSCYVEPVGLWVHDKYDEIDPDDEAQEEENQPATNDPLPTAQTKI